MSKVRFTKAMLGAFTAALLLAGCKGSETVTYTPDLPTGTEEAEIYVKAIDGLADDFICGMDASEVLAEENSGVVYYNYDGKEQDVFQTLADSGINYIRLRVWNDPYDTDGNGYGGCNTDLDTAVTLGQRATKYGMKVCIDFHYSDFWADPNRQLAPKAWEDMTIDEKSQALYDYTVESLNKLIDSGVDVGMVQVGNEINNGLAGETSTENKMALLVSGCKAVRDVAADTGSDIRVVIHYTNISDNSEIKKAALALDEYGVDYDIFGISFYAMWDVTTEDMQTVAKLITETYGKQIMIAETSYCYTAEDGDGYGNSYPTIDENGNVTYLEGYSPTVQGQASMVRDVCDAANSAGAIGVFYWGGTWIPVQEYDADAADAAQVLASNEGKWETYGTGWASSYAAAYDSYSSDYGGCAWDNQAMFDFSGHPLESLKVFKYLRYGATAPVAVQDVSKVTVVTEKGTEPQMPDEVSVYYNDGTSGTLTAEWDEEQLAAISDVGNYTVSGTLSNGTEISADVIVSAVSYLKNGSFADKGEGWRVDEIEASEDDDDSKTGFQKNSWNSYDNGSDENSFHFTANTGDDVMEFTLEITSSALEAGTYQLSVQAEGAVSDGSVVELYAYIDEADRVSTKIALTKWGEWQTGTITGIEANEGDVLTLGVHVKCSSGDYGDIDEFVLEKVQ